MSINSQAKAMLKFQSFGMIGISFLIIAGIFGYFLFKENLSYENRLQTLDREIQQQQKQQIRAEVEKAREFIEHMNSQAEEQLKQQARSAVEQAHSIATSLYNKHRTLLQPSEIKELIKTALRDVRFFNGRGYYF
ncbi:MAG: cache domain-containing protein, partial [Pseudomonadales bacterium]|nr:cache domain-containing protein [Pseudomonadales bacterium]